MYKSSNATSVKLPKMNSARTTPNCMSEKLYTLHISENLQSKYYRTESLFYFEPEIKTAHTTHAGKISDRIIILWTVKYLCTDN